MGVLGILAGTKLDYTSIKPNKIRSEILANALGEALIGWAGALILVKAYANWLVVEVNQICYGGILRTISLGFTEGIRSWKVESLCTLQPMVVPVGGSTLGRIFNVLGATIDAYIGIDELPIYSDNPSSFVENESAHAIEKEQQVNGNISPTSNKDYSKVKTIKNFNLTQNLTSLHYFMQILTQLNSNYYYCPSNHSSTSLEPISVPTIKSSIFSSLTSLLIISIFLCPIISNSFKTETLSFSN